MSVGHTRKTKARRRALDEANPERRRVRRMIRKGLIPRWMIAKWGGRQIWKSNKWYTTDKGKRMKSPVWPTLHSTFVVLTKESK